MELEQVRRAIRAGVDEALPGLRAIRHDLHMHPELGYEEHRTAGRIAEELDRLGIRYVKGLAGGTGVVAHLPAVGSVGGESGGGGAGGAIGLRADIDALPIVEQTGLPYASRVAGRMHACGHDGHTAVLLGAARVLSGLSWRPNPVTLVFQPAEEGGGGADRLCKEGVLDGQVIGPRVSRMYGLHGWPELTVGTVGTRAGALLAATDEFVVTVRGVQSHGAYPQYSRDAVVAAAQCIVALQTVVSRNVAPVDSAVVTVGQVHGGTASNIIPEVVTMTGTLRTLKPETRAMAKARILSILDHTAAAHGAKAEVAWHEGYPVTHNDPALTERFFAVAEGLVGKDRVVRVANPTMGGEDFSYYGQKVPAVFFCLGLKPVGAERYATLHQPDFDFNDEALGVGVEAFCRLAVEG
jgi:amidohydrolase